MDRWAIDYYGLRSAHDRSVLDQVRDTDRLHVSTLTWQPGKAAGVGAIRGRPGNSGASGRLSLVGPDGDQAGSRTTSSMDVRLRELHDRGVLVVADEHECDPQHVADVESSWRDGRSGWVSRRAPGAPNRRAR